MSGRILVATRKGLFDYRQGEAGWRVERVSFLGDSVTLAFSDPRDGHVYAALNHGHFGVKFHRSEDGGARFEETSAPAFPAKPLDSDDPTPWSVQQIWSLETGGPDEPGVLWAGTIPGGLFHSRDRGDSWELVESLWRLDDRRAWSGGGYDYPGIHSICVDPRDSLRITIGISIGGVWTTADGGDSWAPRSRGMFAEYVPPDLRDDPNAQDPHRVVQCQSAPDTFWAQHHNGVFYSADCGESWRAIPSVSPSTFGFAVAVHPRDPDTVWFVPAVKDDCRIPVDAALVVARTRDGGRSFDELRQGLPQEHAYDLVYRHGLDVDESGHRLAMGSTTGGLWVSEDQGDSWQCLSTQLPPIHAVRFVA